MARIFITGSTDGLGQLAARDLIAKGHEVYLHARNEKRAADARRDLPKAAGVIIADLGNLSAVRRLAEEANAAGPFDTVIHNAAVYRAEPALIARVNVLAPYLLTCLMERPGQLMYLSSNDHTWGKWKARQLEREQPDLTYADSKLLITAFALAVDRKWADVRSNAIDPGWVPTKMGGSGAPDDLDEGYATQVWLADDPAAAGMSGRYLYHKEDGDLRPEARDEEKQDELITACEAATGIEFSK